MTLREVQTEKIETEPHWTPAQAAKYLGVPVSWIYGHRHTHTLPFEAIKIGAYVRFKPSTVREFESCTEPPGEHCGQGVT